MKMTTRMNTTVMKMTTARTITTTLFTFYMPSRDEKNFDASALTFVRDSRTALYCTMVQNRKKTQKIRHICKAKQNKASIAEQVNERMREQTRVWPSTPICTLGYSGP